MHTKCLALCFCAIYNCICSNRIFILVMQVSSHIYYSEPRLKILHGLKVSALLSITMLNVTHILLRAGVT